LFFSYYAASFASRGASVYLHFSGLPIDLQIVVLEPGIAEDHALLSEARDSKECSYRVGLVTEDYIYHFGDLSCFVGGAVHIVHWYGARDTLDANTLCMDKVFIYEAVYSSGVQKCLDRMHLTGVSCTDLYRKDDRHSMGVEGGWWRVVLGVSFSISASEVGPSCSEGREGV